MRLRLRRRDGALRVVSNPNLFVLTGGPGAAKTTVLLELEKRGYQVAPEVARRIIQEQVRDGGRALPWADRKLYTDLMLTRSVESYLEYAPASRPVFFDRGIPDTLGYAWLIELEDQGAIRHACHLHRYAPCVFVAPPWREIYRTDSERKQDFAEAVRTCETVAGAYRDCGYEVVELPRSTPGQRADYILERLRQMRTSSCRHGVVAG